MMFPERFTVTHEPRVPGGQDSQGNPVEGGWGDPVVRKVITISPPSADGAIRDELSGVERDLDVLTRTLWGGPGDRVTVDGALFHIVGYPNDFTKHPWGFRGGYRVKLKRVEG